MATTKKLEAQRPFVAEVEGKTVVVLHGARFAPTSAMVKCCAIPLTK